MLRFRDGEEEAFVTLYGRYRERLVNFARRMLGDAVRGEEAAQESFLKLYAARASYTPDSRFSTYLYRIAKNHCLNIRARKEHSLAKHGHDVESEASEQVSPQRAAEQSELRRAVTQALAELPANQRAALVLAHYEGMRHSEIAAVLELSESAVKSAIHRARERMATVLAAWQSNPQPDGGAHHAV